MKKTLIMVVVLSMAVLFYPIMPVTARGEGPVTIGAVGDIMLARRVEKKIMTEGYSYPFDEMKPIMLTADIVIGNLETSLATSGEPLPGKGIWFRADPRLVESLCFAGFKALSLANNHILDYDSPALLETVQVLEKNGIRAFGAGENIRYAREPVYLDVKGTTFVFLGYNEFSHIFWSYKYPRSFAAGEKLPGVAPLEIKIIKEDIAKARQKADVVVVSLHWGIENSNWPTPEQQLLARDIIDSGADVILGHHPHVLQGVEIYKGGVIAYSLGNFVFDQPWENNRQSVFLMININSGRVTEVGMVPVYIKDLRPIPVSGEMGVEILNKIAYLSGPFGTRMGIRQNYGWVLGLEKTRGLLVP